MTSIASTSSGWVLSATKVSRPKRSSTPASMPAASGSGMRCSVFSNRPENPATATSTAHTKNAPIASGSGRPVWLAASIAAAGVDHAVTTGTP